MAPHAYEDLNGEWREAGTHVSRSCVAYYLGWGDAVGGKRSGSLSHILYFAVCNVLLCMLCTHILCALYTGLYPLLNPWYVIIIPMYNVHPYFSLKNLGKKVRIIHSKIR